MDYFNSLLSVETACLPGINVTWPWSSQGYGFSSSHVWLWEVDCKESWVLKNWSFWTVMLEKTLESPLDCKEIQTVHPKENQSQVFTWRTDIEAETPKLWPPDTKNPHLKKPWCWERLKAEEKGTTGDEMVGWHHRLNGNEFEQAPGDGEGKGTLACCSSWGRKEWDMTERLNKCICVKPFSWFILLPLYHPCIHAFVLYLCVYFCLQLSSFTLFS